MGRGSQTGSKRVSLYNVHCLGDYETAPHCGKRFAGIARVDNRRSFVTRVAMWIALLGSCSTAAALAVRYLLPPQRPPRKRSVFVARLDELADGGTRVVEDLRGARVQVVRKGERVLALSMVCPHLGCQVRWDGEQGRFGCPCHEAAFDTEGRVLFGPPPRGLDRYEVEVTDGCIYLQLTEPSSST